ncbi:MAG: hypothetical protein EZS28_029572, partial [Streblomastix strix]
MSKNSIKLEPSELGLFVNFDPQKLTARTPVTTKVDQLESEDEAEKFLQSEQQPKLQDIERQLTPRQAAGERTQMLMAKGLEAMTGVQASEIDFLATEILDEKNGEARTRRSARREAQPNLQNFAERISTGVIQIPGISCSTFNAGGKIVDYGIAVFLCA